MYTKASSDRPDSINVLTRANSVRYDGIRYLYLWLEKEHRRSFPDIVALQLGKKIMSVIAIFLPEIKQMRFFLKKIV